jgi:PAS domain S-box-containing protein
VREVSEAQRLAALRSYQVMDTPPEPVFDQITQLAAHLFRAPMALVSLVDESRQWFKAKVGVDVCETPREVAFCSHALKLKPYGVMVVEDATLDPRFADNPLVVGPPHIRFYAGALLSDRRGANLGTLCVVDTVPRETPSDEELARLRTLADLVVEGLESTRLQRMAAEQERLLNLAEAMSGVGRWHFDLATQTITWSDELYRIFGFDRAKGLELERILERHPPAEREAIQKAMAEALKQRRGFETEATVLRGDDDVRRITIRAAVALDEKDEPTALFGVIQDVTDQRKALESVRRSQTRYKLLADHMGDVVTRIQLDGSSDYISPAIQQLLGYTPKEMAGRPAQAFVYEPDQPKILQAFAELAGGRDESVVQHRAAHKDGRPVWVETRFRLVRDEHGAPKEMVAVIREISARKALEEQLSAAKEAAEAANRAKSDFLANMSHELRTPLHGVIGFSRLLAESPDLSAEDRHRARLVRGAAEALGLLINDVLDFSKLGAGAVTLETRPFGFNDLVSEALSMIEPQATDKGLTLSISGSDPGVLVGDKFRLRQVLLNLLTNAVKFTPQGTITVDVSSASAGEGQERLRVRVIDRGVGIDPDKIGSLFRRFSQADTSVARTYGGTGLGLAISRELIELMGGMIGVESEPGQGSTFWFEITLPRGEVAEGRRGRSRNGRAQFPGRRVLVVDDVELNRELLDVMLKQHGCAPTLVKDGVEAVEAVESGDYDLVFMDIHMPVLDGLVATAAIRAAGFTDLPILAMSASGSPEQVEACLAAGMDGHLVKPLGPDDLEQALARVFREPRPSLAPAPPPGPRDAQAAFEASMGREVALRIVELALEQLEGRFDDADREAVQADAHKTAGSAGLVGLDALGAEARRLEELCASGGDYAEALARVRALSEEGRGELTRWRDRLRSAAG